MWSTIKEYLSEITTLNKAINIHCTHRKVIKEENPEDIKNLATESVKEQLIPSSSKSVN